MTGSQGTITAAGAQPAPEKPAPSVLCVDLDGTLIKTDLLWECILLLLKTRPWSLLLLPLWILRGRAALKREIAARVNLKPSALPYRSDLIEFLKTERNSGRRLVLVTAADKELAQNVAGYLGLFEQVYASDQGRNLKGKSKAQFLQSKFGEAGFEYIGDSRPDLHVWKASRAGYVVGRASLARRASATTEIKGVFQSKPAGVMTWIRALRGHHWSKNLLLFLPLVLAHKIQPHSALVTLIGFILFGTCASSLYVLNDLLDLHSDRAHPWKAARPFAAGEASIRSGLMVSSLLITASLCAAFAFNKTFGAVLVTYAFLTILYSLRIKQIVLLDIFVLTSFYGMRIWAGSLISSVSLSQWFLAFSMFFFLSLAMAKRYSELVHAENLVKSGDSGRAYLASDRDLLSSLGIGSCFAAVVIFSLYVHSPEVLVLYPRPQPLLLLCPLILFWLSYVWLKAHRGELREDPVTLAIRDPLSYAIFGLMLGVIAISMIR